MSWIDDAVGAHERHVDVSLIVEGRQGNEGRKLAPNRTVARRSGEGAAEDAVPVFVHELVGVDREREKERIGQGSQRERGGGNGTEDPHAQRGAPVLLVDQVRAAQRRDELGRGRGGLGGAR